MLLIWEPNPFGITEHFINAPNTIGKSFEISINFNKSYDRRFEN